MDDSIIKVGSYSFSSVCCFSRLFYGCSSAAKPHLPAKSVAYLCRAQTEFHASEVIYGMPALQLVARPNPCAIRTSFPQRGVRSVRNTRGILFALCTDK